MRLVNLMVLATLGVIYSSANSTAAPNININALTSAPPGFNAGTGKDINIDNLNTQNLPGVPPESQPYRFHVNLGSGINDLHITVPPGQEPPPIQLTQNLFSSAVLTGLQVDLSGSTLPKDTYFTFNSNVSFALTPSFTEPNDHSALPEPSTFLLLGTGLVTFLFMRRHKKIAIQMQHILLRR